MLHCNSDEKTLLPSREVREERNNWICFANASNERNFLKVQSPKVALKVNLIGVRLASLRRALMWTFPPNFGQTV
jgi:hypothetical protein